MKKKMIRKKLEEILSVLRCDNAELSVLLTSPERMKELNRQWRGENRAADVLSFPQGAGGVDGEHNEGNEGAPPQVLGDLAIRADKERITDRQLAHGVLHLLGYEHGTRRKYSAMRKKEDEILAALKNKSN